MVKTETKIFFLVCVLLGLSILFMAHLNYSDIQACKEAGNSEETCLTIINP